MGEAVQWADWTLSLVKKIKKNPSIHHLPQWCGSVPIIVSPEDFWMNLFTKLAEKSLNSSSSGWYLIKLMESLMEQIPERCVWQQRWQYRGDPNPWILWYIYMWIAIRLSQVPLFLRSEFIGFCGRLLKNSSLQIHLSSLVQEPYKAFWGFF